MPLLFQTAANYPGSMPVPNEIDLLSTRVDSYRQPIDTQTTPFRHPKRGVFLFLGGPLFNDQTGPPLHAHYQPQLQLPKP